MPYSSASGKEQIVNWFKENESNISKILDIGAGSGTYPKLIKEQNFLCVNAQWIGIEAWNPYVTKFNLKNLYNNLIVEDVKKVNLYELGSVDVAIAGDILEHMTKDEAVLLTDKILEISKCLIISIPIVHMPQGEYEGNPYEIHVKDDWTHAEVLETWGSKIKNHYREHDNTDIGVYWLSK